MTERAPAARESLGSQTASIFAISIAQYLVGFAASALLSRMLGPGGRGVYYLPILAVTTILAVCKLGIDQTNIYLAGSRAVSLARMSAQNTLVAFAMGAVACGLTVMLPWIVPQLVAGTPVSFLLIAGLTIPVTIHSQLTAGLLSLAARPRVQYRAGLIGAIVQIAMIAGLTATHALTPATALLTTLLVTIVTWLLLLFALRTLAPVRPTLDTALLRETLRHSWILHVSALLFFLHLRLDMFMVKLWLGVEALGLYSLSAVLGETLMLATESVALAILPGQISNRLDAAGARAVRASRAVVVLGGILALGWTAFGLPLIRLVFGSAYASSYGPLVALLPGMVALGVQRICSAPALRAGRPMLVAAISAGSLACNGVLNTLWIPRWGLYGASAASSVSYMLSTALFFVWTVRLAGMPLRQAVVVDAADWRALGGALRSLRTAARATILSV